MIRNDNSTQAEPVVGWLVCVSGEHLGEDFSLKPGRNYIGRGNDNDIVISKDSAVSYDNKTVIIYEPEGRTFFAMPGEPEEICCINGETVLSQREIWQNDKLTVGETVLMFIPCCGESFSWEGMQKQKP